MGGGSPSPAYTHKGQLWPEVTAWLLEAKAPCGTASCCRVKRLKSPYREPGGAGYLPERLLHPMRAAQALLQGGSQRKQIPHRYATQGL